MPFIQDTDFPASIRADILAAITAGDDTVRTDNIDRAVDEVKAYLNGRYDIVATFNATGNVRNKFVLRLCLALCVYYIFLTCNPRKITQAIKEEYDKALEDLEKIQAGDLNPDGLPLPAAPQPPGTPNGGPVQWGGSCPVGSDW